MLLDSRHLQLFSPLRNPIASSQGSPSLDVLDQHLVALRSRELSSQTPTNSNDDSYFREFVQCFISIFRVRIRSQKHMFSFQDSTPFEI